MRRLPRLVLPLSFFALLCALPLLLAVQNDNSGAYARKSTSRHETTSNPNKAQAHINDTSADTRSRANPVNSAPSSSRNGAANAQNSTAAQRYAQAPNPQQPTPPQQQQQQQGIQMLQSQYSNNAALQKAAGTALHAGPQPDGSIIGIIGDSKCGRQHWDRPGLGPAGCARWCVERGAHYILITDTQIYPLGGDQRVIENFAGEAVRIKGGPGAVSAQNIEQVDLPTGNTIQPKELSQY